MKSSRKEEKTGSKKSKNDSPENISIQCRQDELRRLWTQLQDRTSDLISKTDDPKELNNISRVLTQAQKGLTALDSDHSDLLVVNIHIPGVCDCPPRSGGPEKQES